MNEPNVIDAEFTDVAAEPFDYTELDAETAEQLKEIAEQDMRATAIFWIARAERLTKAHELLANNRNGTFGEWVEKEIGIHRKTGEKLVKAYAGYLAFIGAEGSNKNADFLPQSFYRKLAANDPDAEKIKDDVLAGKIKDSKEYKSALEEIRALKDEKSKAQFEAKNTIDNLKSVLQDTRKQLFDTKKKAMGADEEYLKQLQAEADRAKAEARKANLDFEELQGRIEELDKRGGDAIRERDKYAQMLDEIAGELKQAQELNARLIAEKQDSATGNDIAVLLATAIRQVTDENMPAIMDHISGMSDGDVVLQRLRAVGDYKR